MLELLALLFLLPEDSIPIIFVFFGDGLLALSPAVVLGRVRLGFCGSFSLGLGLIDGRLVLRRGLRLNGFPLRLLFGRPLFFSLGYAVFYSIAPLVLPSKIPLNPPCHHLGGAKGADLGDTGC